jgi:hypothetical protein
MGLPTSPLSVVKCFLATQPMMDWGSNSRGNPVAHEVQVLLLEVIEVWEYRSEIRLRHSKPESHASPELIKRNGRNPATTLVGINRPSQDKMWAGALKVSSLTDPPRIK